MNTTEKIVESYFRICRKCFTMADVKVAGGNNRQLDLAAYSIEHGSQYHIEIGVTHSQAFEPNTDMLERKLKRKFFGEPREANRPNSSTRPNRCFYPSILKSYEAIGFSTALVQRIWVSWHQPDRVELNKRIQSHCVQHGITEYSIEFLSFRDDIIPQLMKDVGTSNYGDDALRTLSLLRQRERQERIKRERNRQSKIERE